MNESDVLRFALGCSVVGIFLLLFLLSSYTYDDFIGDPTVEQSGVVQLSGMVKSVRVTNASSRVTILALMPVTVTVLESAQLDVGSNVTVIGQIEDFRGEKQIVAQRLYAKKEKN
ncbi:MAG TPA: hypothetical protein VK158_04300 [Acidobacteriota bacterium]|nr:hypothetical protein [Acidobacteriota bacterium]